MNITIKKIRENADGSADADIYLDEEAKDMLIRKAIIDTLKEAVQYAEQNVTPKDDRQMSFAFEE